MTHNVTWPWLKHFLRHKQTLNTLLTSPLPSYSVSNIPFNFDQDTTLRRFWYDLGAGCEKLKLYTLFCLKLSKVYFSVSEIDTPFSTCHNIHNIWRPNVFLCNEDMRLKKVFQRWHSEAFHLVCILKTGEMCLTLFNIFLSITDIEFLINKGKVMLERISYLTFFLYFLCISNLTTR